MTKIGIVINGEWEYPIYRSDGKYHIDLGGSFGMSDPLSFESDTKAIVALHEAFEGNEWEMSVKEDCDVC